MNSEKLRKIKSFVRREGRITPAQNKALLAGWPKFGLEVAHGKLDLESFSGNARELVLEVGFGNGEALFTMARDNPEVNYLGVEVHRPGIGALFLKMEEEGVSNIKVFQEDVNEVLLHCIPDECLSGIHIFFPDPWPKKRHQKRRLIQFPFVDLLWHKLKLCGYLHLATDWEDYAKQMMEVMSMHEKFNNVAGQGNYLSDQTLRPQTKFERRGLKLGHEVWDLKFVRSP